ncbi:MAG: M48 family metallopeptidase [Helicobacteraceae bacterium]|jgi:predicted Zn-dependent protease|nr:M48 family metallopeptidase [Helicobacteraceae bacterium]
MSETNQEIAKNANNKPNTPRSGEIYENPTIPEGINVSADHPLKEFGALIIGAVALVAALAWIIGYIGYFAGSLVSFETEARIAAAIESLDKSSSARSVAEQKLNDLAQRLIAADPLPQGMSVVLRVVESDTPNAFATLGGRVFVTTALIDASLSENALSMVIAHEIGHIRARHVIGSLSRGILLSVTFKLIFGAQDGELASQLIGQAGATTALTFSRSDEEEADRLALKTLNAYYGHVADAAAFFEMIQAKNPTRDAEAFSTHPDLQKRIEALERFAKANGWALEGEIAPSPFR